MKRFLLLGILSALISVCHAQTYYYNDQYFDRLIIAETGLSIGAMNCLTDLGGKPGRPKPFYKDINWNCTRRCAGAFVSFLYRYTIGGRLEIAFGNVNAADSVLRRNISDAVNRYNRNLHFKSRITECLLMFEFHPLSLLQDPYEYSPRLSPYLAAGVGIFSFDPKTFHNGQWISLSPLRTEGQGFPTFPERLPYKTTQINFPLGFGLKYEASALFNIRWEFIYRFLNTDYLDDVSDRYIDPALFYQYLNPSMASLAATLSDRRRPGAAGGGRRGNPEKNDGYFSLSLKLSIIVNRKRT